jgi:EmrB/QacA subfamily drug resistance transporter
MTDAPVSDAEPIRFASRRGRWVLAVTVLGSGIAFLEATVVNVALPEIGRDLDADVGGLQWILNGYLLTLAALILIGGALGDRYGRRRVFNLGIAWFTGASLLCAIAPSVELLVAARVLQGVGGAMLTPGSLAIIEATFHPDDRGRAIGAWSALGGIAAAVGPLVGGYLVDAVSWRAIFLINLPLGAFVIAAAARHVPETTDPTAGGRLDLAGGALATIGLAGVTFALIQASEDSMAPETVAVAAGAGLIALAVFALYERGAASPMLPLGIFASGQFRSANAVTFVVYGALGGVFFLLVVFLQVSVGYSPIGAGAAALPVTVLLFLLSSRAGALAQRIGPRLPLTVGPLLIGAGMLLMTRIESGQSYGAGVLPAVLVFGLGLSATVAPVTATALAAADPRHSGVASGINNAVARTAQLVAVAVLPLAAGLTGGDFQDPAALEDGFRTAMFISAALAALGGLLAFTTISDDVLETVPSGPEEGSPERAATDRSCAVAGTPLRPAREARCVGASRAPREVSARAGSKP